MTELDIINTINEMLKVLSDKDKDTFIIQAIKKELSYVNKINNNFNYIKTFIKKLSKESLESKEFKLLLKHALFQDNIAAVKWLSENILELDLHEDQEYILRYSSQHGNKELVEYCIRQECDITILRYDAIKNAIINENEDIAILLYNKYPEEHKDSVIKELEEDNKKLNIMSMFNKEEVYKINTIFSKIKKEHEKWKLKENLNNQLKQKDFSKKVKI